MLSTTVNYFTIQYDPQQRPLGIVNHRLDLRQKKKDKHINNTNGWRVEWLNYITIQYDPKRTPLWIVNYNLNEKKTKQDIMDDVFSD